MPSGSKQPGALSKEVAAILRAQIARRSLRQDHLSQAVGISQAQMSGILNGKKLLDIEQLDRICWAIGLKYRDVIAEADDATMSRHAEKDWHVDPL